MKANKLILLFMTIFLAAGICMAEKRYEGTSITVGHNVPLPVYIKINGGGMIVVDSREYETRTKIQNVSSITDGDGNRCIYTHEHHYMSGIGIHYYIDITGVYSPSRSFEDESYSSSSVSSYGDYSSQDDKMSNFTNGFTDAVFVPVTGYPCLSIGGGISRFTGEFARLKWSVGGYVGFVFQAGVGKDLFFDLPNKDKTAWDAGIGLRIGKSHHDMSVNILFGRTPLCEDHGVLLNLEYEYFFGKKKQLGVFGSIGTVGDTGDEDGATWFFDFSIGVAFKLWQK